MKTVLAALVLAVASISQADAQTALRGDTKENVAAILVANSLFASTTCPWMTTNTEVLGAAVEGLGFQINDFLGTQRNQLVQQQLGFLRSPPLKVACEAVFDAYGPNGKVLKGLIERK